MLHLRKTKARERAREANEKLSKRTPIRLGQFLGDGTLASVSKLLDVNAASVTRIGKLAAVPRTSLESLEARLLSPYIGNGVILECFAERGRYLQQEAGRRAIFSGPLKRRISDVRAEAGKHHDGPYKIALNVISDSTDSFLFFDQQSFALSKADELDDSGLTGHAEALRRSVAAECFRVASERMCKLRNAKTALTWSEWTNSTGEALDKARIIKLLATREAVADVNSLLVLLYTALNFCPDGQKPEIESKIVEIAGDLANSSFIQRSLEIGKVLSDPRVTWNAATTLARAGETDRAGEALALTVKIDNHVEGVGTYHPSWLTKPVRSFDYMQTTVETARQLIEKTTSTEGPSK